MLGFNQWHQEYCHLCSSANYIFINDPFVFIYECWNCHNKTWIDDSFKEAYTVMSGLPASQVEDNLFKPECTIPCAQGYCEKG